MTNLFLLEVGQASQNNAFGIDMECIKMKKIILLFSIAVFGLCFFVSSCYADDGITISQLREKYRPEKQLREAIVKWAKTASKDSAFVNSFQSGNPGYYPVNITMYSKRPTNEDADNLRADPGMTPEMLNQVKDSIRQSQKEEIPPMFITGRLECASGDSCKPFAMGLLGAQTKVAPGITITADAIALDLGSSNVLSLANSCIIGNSVYKSPFQFQITSHRKAGGVFY